jgi:hypothetical protein
LGRAALPLVAVVVFVAFLAGVLAFAGETLGYDLLAYHQAARRVLSGDALYDLSFEAAGGFGLFYYPPFFAPLILPFGVLTEGVAIWLWIALLLSCFALGVSLLPVAPAIRWTVVLLAGLSWPFLYAVKLGQVGPILFLLFAAGWRWLDDPHRLGSSMALGTAVKLQPGLLFFWAAITGRWKAVATGLAVLAGLAVVATLVAGIGVWWDFVRLVGRVADPITTPHNVTPGAIAFQAGMAPDAASVVQWLFIAATLVTVVIAGRLASPDSSYLAAVVGSQLLSPILWDHYAMLLLLPVAWLCARGQWWSVLIPLSTALPLVGVTPPVAYPVGFVLALAAVVALGVRERQGSASASASRSVGPA